MRVRIIPLGESALVVELPDPSDETSPRLAQAASGWLESPPLPGVSELVPAAATVTLFYSPAKLVTAGAPADDLAGWLTARIRERLATLPAPGKLPPARLVEIPVCYGGDFGPDLVAAADRLKLSAAEIISRHSAAEYFVLQLGFAPGFPYLGGLPAELALPRRDTPRTVVPCGSVGIANRQSCVYPLATPGGWNLIGRTPLRLFRPELNPPALLSPGDRVKFHEISPAEFRQLEATA